MDALDDRLRLVDRLLADPPRVHPMGAGPDAPIGVWRTDADCYRFLASRCAPGTRTLETGSGLSTALFCGWRTHHHCVTPGEHERDRLLAYCEAHALPTDRITFDLGSSHAELPRLQRELDALDVVLVDGGHGFPLPIVDWFYAAPLLVPGGALVVDDISLPAVQVLVGFLDRDPRWAPLARTGKWAAYERGDDGDLVEDWTEQPFFGGPESGARAWLRRVKRAVAGAARGRSRR